jgi:predicted metal-dependent hydrolase
VNEEEKKEQLFFDGLQAYEEKDFFEAHELWEELWSEYYLDDKTFIQGLIQLAVSFVHLGNGNLNGAKSLMKKSGDKFSSYSGLHRGINIDKLKQQIVIIINEYEQLLTVEGFDWTHIPELRNI